MNCRTCLRILSIANYTTLALTTDLLLSPQWLKLAVVLWFLETNECSVTYRTCSELIPQRSVCPMCFIVMKMSLNGSGFRVLRSWQVVPDENPVTQHASVPQVEHQYLGCRKHQSGSNRSVPVLSGRFLPQLWCDLYASWKGFVLQRRICPKYNFKGDAPPCVSSAGRVFAAREAFIFACCVTLGLLLFCALWRIFQFSPGLFFAVGRLLASLSASDRCRQHVRRPRGYPSVDKTFQFKSIQRCF